MQQRHSDGTFSPENKETGRRNPPRKLGNRVSYVCAHRSRRVVQRFRETRGLSSDSQAFDALMEYVCKLDIHLIPADEA